MSMHLQLQKWPIFLPSVPDFPAPFSRSPNTSSSGKIRCCSEIKAPNLRNRSGCCAARRRVRYEEEELEEDDEYGYNEQISMLESYTQSATSEALIVRAAIDSEQVEVVIFKGFSSCLSYRTSPDPSRSVLPARAVIESIDRIKGPFDPTNIEYLQKGISWESFKTILPPK